MGSERSVEHLFDALQAEVLGIPVVRERGGKKYVCWLLLGQVTQERDMTRSELKLTAH